MTFRPPPRARFRLWPLRAVRDAQQPTGRVEDEVFTFQNCYAQDTEVGPLVVGRPGFSAMGVQLGSSGTRRGQLITQLTKRDGTEYTVAIVDGLFYTYNWGTDTWSEVVTTANFTTASITLSATATCYATTFADQLIVSDGVNLPWAWDGQSGAGGLTSLTNAAVAFGPPVVYYGKLFFVKNAARQTIIWSEEGDPETGYEAGGFTNAWDLIQTRTEGLTALAATNEALYYARANSVGAITGAVTTDFQTTGTREAVDSDFGTLSPGGFLVVGGRVWFVDQYGGFRVATIGQSKEIGTGARETMRLVPQTNFDVIQAYDDPETGHVKFGIPDAGASDPNFEIWLDRETGRYASLASGYTYSRVGVVKNASLVPTVVHLGGDNALVSDSGYAYEHGHPDGSTWDDGFADGAVDIQHTVEFGQVGHDTHADKLWLRGEVSVIPRTAMTGTTLRFITPSETSDPLTLSTIESAGGTPLGVFVLGTDTLGGDAEETKRTFQMRRRGRWCRVRLQHGAASERLALSELALEAVAVSRRPGVM